MKDLVPWGGMNWAPFRDLRKEVNRLFDSVFQDETTSTSTAQGWSPLVDIKESPEGYEIIAELPGIDRKDIKISMAGNTLNLSGERKREDENLGESFHRVERYYGQFSRSFNFEQEVDPSKITATYKNGVLTISATKLEKAKAKEIEIEIG